MQLQAPSVARLRFYRRPSWEFDESPSDVSEVEIPTQINSKPSQVELLASTVLEAGKDREDNASGTFFYRITKTILVYFACFSLGSCNAVVGPSLPDFQIQVRESLQTTSFVFTARSAGYLVGSVVGGACFDRYENQLMLALSSLCAAIFGVLVACSDSFALLICIIALWGFFSGFQETGINYTCVKIWKDSGPWIQGLNFFYAVGGTLAPLIAGPFLSRSDDESTTTLPSTPRVGEIENTTAASVARESFKYDSSPEGNLSSAYIFRTLIQPTLQTLSGGGEDSNISLLKHDEVTDGLGRLWVPYGIIAAFNLTVAMAFFWLFSRGSRRIAIPKPPPEPGANSSRDSAAAKSDRLFRSVILMLMFLFYFAYIGNEIVYSGFIYTFAISSDLGFTTKSASYLNSVFWGGFAVVCAFGIGCSIFLTPRTMLIIDLLGICVSSILLVASGDKSEAGLWGGTILLGASMATLFPTGVSWVERYIKLTGKAMGVLVMSSACAEMVLPWVLGWLFSVVGIMVLMYATFVLSVCTVIVYIVMQAIASRHGERRKSKKDKTTDSGPELEPESGIELQV